MYNDAYMLRVLNSTNYRYNPTLDKEIISYYNYIDEDIFIGCM